VALDLEGFSKELRTFISAYKTDFDQLGTRYSQLLELAALTLAVNHYRGNGFAIKSGGLTKTSFRVKRGASGHPWNFSWFEATKEDVQVEIHANLAVRGNFGLDDGVYVVDVAIVKAGSVPHQKPKDPWFGADNDELVTFVEAKALVIYPMLLAQCIGIVLEILPRFLTGPRPKEIEEQGHFFPALVSFGRLHGRAATMIDWHERRDYWITFVPDLDESFTAALSPLDRTTIQSTP
jgi:hypothetical protein